MSGIDYLVDTNAYNIKLPDAIIAATAIEQNLTLITADTGFEKIKELNLKLITP